MSVEYLLSEVEDKIRWHELAGLTRNDDSIGVSCAPEHAEGQTALYTVVRDILRQRGMNAEVEVTRRPNRVIPMNEDGVQYDMPAADVVVELFFSW